MSVKEYRHVPVKDLKKKIFQSTDTTVIYVVYNDTIDQKTNLGIVTFPIFLMYRLRPSEVPVQGTVAM